MARVVAITGASAGIGRAVALGMLEAGWKVALLARRPEPLEEIAAAAPDRAIALPCDVADPVAVETAFTAVAARFGRLDALFNNAGIFPPGGTIDEIAVEDWLEAVEINLNGMFFCARAAFGQMRRQDPQGGRIVNNGSVSSQAPRPGATAYTATKHAITGLTRSIALDGRAFDIACGQIDIGNAATDMVAAMGKGVPQADGSRRPEPVMDVANVVQSVRHMLELPLEANIPFMTVMATKMPLIGRG